MKNKIYFVTATFLFLNGAFCQSVKVQKTKINHSNFKLIFKEGVEVKHPNILNTFDNTYTHDMVVDSSVKVTFKLSNKDLTRIYQKMDSIDFFNYPDTLRRIPKKVNKDSLMRAYRTEDSLKYSQSRDTVYISALKGETICSQESCDKYYFKVQYNDAIKELRWVDCICDESEKAKRLKQLIILIDKIIFDNPKYKKLPRPRAGYL